MATENISKVAVSVKLDDGTDSQGNPKTVNVPFPTLDKAGFDADKALSIVDALEPCLNKSVASVQKTTTSTINSD